MAAAPHFRIPLNLPHAGTLATRIQFHLRGALPEESGLLVGLLLDCVQVGENPPAEEATRLVKQSAAIGRRIVDEIERRKLGHDRLGQAVRNFFECLGLGEEGAAISLRAGENPASLLRPN